VRWLVERRLSKLVVAGGTGYPQVPHDPACLVCLSRRRAEARLPPDLRPAGPQQVTERAANGSAVGYPGFADLAPVRPEGGRTSG
jgi:hypothetical protein